MYRIRSGRPSRANYGDDGRIFIVRESEPEEGMKRNFSQWRRQMIIMQKWQIEEDISDEQTKIAFRKIFIHRSRRAFLCRLINDSEREVAANCKNWGHQLQPKDALCVYVVVCTVNTSAAPSAGRKRKNSRAAKRRIMMNDWYDYVSRSLFRRRFCPPETFWMMHKLAARRSVGK